MRSDTEIPAHIAIVMDGNGRWALQRNRPRSMGHKAGLKALRAVIGHCGKLGVGELTVFAFSSENWNRPEQEVNRLMDLFMRALDREAKELNENKVRIRFIGDVGAFSAALRRKIHQAETQTANNTGMIFNVAVNYGGRWDIVQATRKLAEECSRGLIKPADINEKLLADLICLNQSKYPDLLIRTGGEMRISNFLLWQCAYTELHFTTTLWPDFGPESLDQAITVYQSRERRFGLTSEQLRKSSRIFRQPASGPNA